MYGGYHCCNVAFYISFESSCTCSDAQTNFENHNWKKFLHSLKLLNWTITRFSASLNFRCSEPSIVSSYKLKLHAPWTFTAHFGAHLILGDVEVMGILIEAWTRFAKMTKTKL